MKKIILLFTVIFLFGVSTNAQTDTNKSQSAQTESKETPKRQIFRAKKDRQDKEQKTNR